MASSWLSPFWSHPIGARIAYYPTLLFGLMKTNAERRWYDPIDERVILGALPFHKTAAKLVSTERVTRVITLNEVYETRFLCPNKKQWSKLGIKQLCIPTVDYNNAPTLKQVKEAVDFIENVETNSLVYVHCKAGRSRSATVVICYLMNYYKFCPDEAIDFVKSKRPHIVLGKRHRETINEYHQLL